MILVRRKTRLGVCFMIDGKKVLAVVPARGGSKRLPTKNILMLSGKPLIAWSIEAGLSSKYVDRVIVSTDDQEIANISKQWGADVPFIRPDELASDSATTMDTIVHALNSVDNAAETYAYILLLQPTSPLRTSAHIDEAVELMVERSADSVIGVSEVLHPYEWSNTLPENLSMDDFISKEAYFTRSQDFPKRYQINGAIYLIKKDSMLLSGRMISDINSVAYIMDKLYSIDIDDEYDFLLAESLFKKVNG